LLILGIFLLSGCTCGIQQTDRGLTEIPVISSESVAVSPWNDKIEDALRAGEKWPYSPLELVIRLLDAEQETRQVTIQTVADRTENPEQVTVTIIRDGFLDDSARGDWHRILLVRKEDGAWRISGMKRSRRCWRPENDSFQVRQCH
jgi:hypothetical protein